MRQTQADLTPRIFRLALLLIALTGLALRIYVGRRTFIDYDEWQHLFMAASARWSDLEFELRTNAHPPLYFLLLGGIVRLGNVALYRSISIAAGAASIVVVGLIARRIFESPIVQLLCAAAFALSGAAIAVSAEIRSYQLMVFLVLIAFWAWLKMFPDGDARPPVRTCIVFAVCSSLAVLTHYSTAFFLGACVMAPVVTRRRWKWPAAIAIAVPCAVFAIAYVVHAGAQPMQGYLYDFYFGATPNETLVSFLAKNAQNFFNLFSPIELRSEAAALAVILVVCAVTAWVFARWPRTRPAIAFAGVVVLELIGGALAQKYPFGGMLRHQYIAGPFLLIAAFAVVDALLPLARPGLRSAVSALLLVAIAANGIFETPRVILFPGAVLLRDEFNSWRAAFPNIHAVYVDHWSVIGYFMHTSKQPRTFVRRIAASTPIEEYSTPDGTAIFYDKLRILFDFADPTVYKNAAACLRQSGRKELTLLFYSAGNKPMDRAPAELESLIGRRAAEQGLTATKVLVTGTSVAAGFKLKETE